MLLYYFFLSLICLDHGQIWAITERTASPTLTNQASQTHWILPFWPEGHHDPRKLT